MSVDHIRYDLLTQQALRAVVRRVLADVAKSGLPGEHHFYVTFDTRAPGVKLSARMREQYPEEMTIVLQHQFWDLNVSETQFEVALSFNGVSEKLHVPFEAIKGFFDPSVQFGLQFEPSDGTAEPEAAAPKLPAAPAPTAVGAPAPASAPATADEPEPPAAPSEGAEVVRLDRFRKK